jgi:hypothetical protein
VEYGCSISLVRAAAGAPSLFCDEDYLNALDVLYCSGRAQPRAGATLGASAGVACVPFGDQVVGGLSLPLEPGKSRLLVHAGDRFPAAIRLP